MARGAAVASAKLKYDAEMYTPGRVQEWSDSELRKEYTRLRDIAQKRIKRMSQEAVGKTSDLYNEFKHGFPKIRDIIMKEDLGKALADVARFVQGETSTVGGAKISFQRKLKKLGLKEEDVKNIYDLDEWMEIVRLKYTRDMFDSDLAVQYYKDCEGINLSIEDYERWLIGEDEYQEDAETEPDSSSDDWDFDEI